MIFRFELKKVLTAPVVLGFLAVMIAVNVIYVFATSQKTTIDYYNVLSETTGTSFGTALTGELKSVRQPTEDDYVHYYLYKDFAGAASSAEQTWNSFETVRGNDLKDTVAAPRFPTSELAKEIQFWKYEKLKPVIEEKIERGDAASVYFSNHTNEIHGALFTYFFRLLGTQSAILFILLMLFALGYERMAGTDMVVYAARKGRGLVLTKGLAALCAATLCFIVLYGVSCGVLFLVNDVSIVWPQNVSALFHTVYSDNFGSYPFITWGEMTIGSYFFGCVLVSYLQCLVMALFTAPFGLLVRNVYVAFCAVAGACFVHFMLIIHPALEHFAYYLLMLEPLPQLFFNQFWFSDGGDRMLLPHFEWLYPLICIAVLTPVILACLRRFYRKDFI
jgi:hypothetical protein